MFCLCLQTACDPKDNVGEHDGWMMLICSKLLCCTSKNSQETDESIHICYTCLTQIFQPSNNKITFFVSNDDCAKLDDRVLMRSKG